MKAPATEPVTAAFSDLGLSAPVLEALAEVGYESPSPIQAATIPVLLAGKRHDRPGADRHRQDCRVRAAAAESHQDQGWSAAGHRARADARTRDPGGRGLPEIRVPDQGIPRAADLWRAELYAAADEPQARCSRRRWHAGPRDGPHQAWHAGPRRRHLRRARRSRRDAADGLRRRHRVDPRADSGHEAGRPVLGDAAGPDPAHRAEAPARTGRGHGRQQDQHRHQHPAALLDRERRAQARRADAHPRGRSLRRHARVHAYQAVDRRTGGAARGARVRCRGAERRHAAEGPRAHGGAHQGRTARHPGRDGRRRARSRRRANQPRRQLRRALRHRIVRASHRPHRTGGTQWRGDTLHHAARAQHAALHRACDPLATPADGPADHCRRERAARRALPAAHHRGARRRTGRTVPQPDRGVRARTRRARDRDRRGAREPAAGRQSAAAQGEGARRGGRTARITRTARIPGRRRLAGQGRRPSGSPTRTPRRSGSRSATRMA